MPEQSAVLDLRPAGFRLLTVSMNCLHAKRSTAVR